MIYRTYVQQGIHAELDGIFPDLHRDKARGTY